MENEKEKVGQEENPQALKVEDLPVEEAAQDDVKGGTSGARISKVIVDN